tara:strand:- start:467 stop:892 length:426 start_codon:yes stop_codon:yes gene_type:complete
MVRTGRQGEIAERTDGVIRMTVRTPPSVLQDRDIAMFIGYICDVRKPDRYTIISELELSSHEKYENAKQAIHDWEHNFNHTPLSKKRVMSLLTCNYYLSQFEEETDMYDTFDEDCVQHQVLLEKVHEIFPSFVVKENEVIG